MKNFTQEEIIKKHQTNIKSAVTALFLAGVLGIIFAVRYAVKGDFDFYFSFGFTEALLRLFDEGTLSVAPTALLAAFFFICYILFGALATKNQKWLYACLGLYLFDFVALGVMMLVILPRPLPGDTYIDVILHGFITVFICVGIYSHRKLEAQGIKAE